MDLEAVIQSEVSQREKNKYSILTHAPTSNAEEAEVEQFYKDLQDLLELSPKKDVPFIIGNWNAKVESQEMPEVTANLALC